MRNSKWMLGLAAAAAMGSAQADTPVLSEGFDDVAALIGAGWTFSNASTPVGQDWFQGNAGIFTAQAGADNAYIAANFLSSSSDTGVISNWVITPSVTLTGGESISFYVRTPDVGLPGFLDVVKVYVDAGSGFGSALFSVAAPTSWTQFTVAIPGNLAGSAKVGFQYSVANALDANYVGLDTVVIAIPEPAPALLLGLGLAGLVLRRRLSA